MTPQRNNKSNAGTIIISMETCGIVPPLRRPRCETGLVNITKPTFLRTEEKPRNSLDEFDPKKMDFSQLIDLVHPKFITDYLQRILNFLLDNTIEINFPNIAPFKRAFLERLVSDQNNLKCSRFDAQSKAVADRIVEVLRFKEYQFKWTYSYENRSLNRGVLVYKKQYIKNNNEAEFKHPSSIPPKKLHSLIGNSKTTETLDNNSVPTNFKIQWLNTTLKFIKDDTQMTLEYPEMTLPMAEFIYAMINKSNLGLDSYGYKSLYAPLWEAKKIFSLKYDFKVICKCSGNTETTFLALQKIPKTSKKLTVNENGKRKVTCPRVQSPSPCRSSASRSVNENGKRKVTCPRVQSPSPCRSSASSESSSSLYHYTSLVMKRPHEFLKLQKLNQLIHSLRPQYLTDCLNQLLDFTINDCEGSLILQTSSLSEEKLLSRILALAKAEEKHWLFSNPADRSALKGINVTLSEAKSKGLWSMMLNWRVINKEQRKKEAHFQKIPKCNYGNTASPLSSDLKITDKEVKLDIESPRIKFLKALGVDNFSDESVCNDNAKTNNRHGGKSRDSSIDSQSNNENVRKKYRAIKKQPSPVATSSDLLFKKPINFQSAGPLDPVDQSISPLIDQPTASIDKLVNLSGPKKKTFEAMSTPMDSDIGTRMMKLMGWRGGALGARGEGITEPIIPAMLIKTGAGLGHVPEPPKPAKTKKEKKQEAPVTIKQPDVQLPKKLTKSQRTNFRITFLRHLLEHIKGDAAEVKIEFNALSRNETKFMQVALHSFNHRRKVGLNTQEEVSYLRQIEDELHRSQYVFKAEIDSLTRSAIITKSILPITARSQKHENKPNKNKTKPTREDSITRLQDHHTSRLSILENIAEFLKSSDKETEINFNDKGNKAGQRLDLIITQANKKIILDHPTSKEFLVFSEILNNMKDCCLVAKSVDEVRHKYIVQKVFRRKFINSALKPPKNNKILTDYINNNKSDDDDVLIIDDGEELDDIDMTTHNYNEKTLEKNNNYLKKVIDVEYEKQMFQKEIDNIEKSDTVDRNTQVTLKSKVTDCEVMTDFDTDIRNLEQAMRETKLELNDKDIHFETALLDADTKLPGKRLRTDSQNTDENLCIPKKYKNTCNPELICIVPKNYPTDKITIETAKQVQYIIAQKMDMTVFLPLLECHGLKSGTLVYACHNQKSTLWLQGLVEDANLDIKYISCDTSIYEINDKYTFNIKINTLIDQNMDHLFFNLEVFNIGLTTTQWKVLNETRKDDCLIISVIVDQKSYKFIREHEFALHAGFDKALFSLLW